MAGTAELVDSFGALQAQARDLEEQLDVEAYFVASSGLLPTYKLHK